MSETAHPGDDSQRLAAEVRPLVERLHADLDTLSYYQFLGVGRDASAQAIQQAFYRRAVQLHPDRHFKLQDPELKGKIREVYKRIAEGYRVLSSPSLRRIYDTGLRRGEVRIKQRAFDPAAPDGSPTGSAAAQTSQGTTQTRTDAPSSSGEIHDASAKELFDQASAKLKERDFGRAVELLEQALRLEPDSDVIARRLVDARRLKRLWS